MADTAPDLKEMPDALRANKSARLSMVLSVLRRRRRHGVIEHDAQPLRVKHLARAQFLVENLSDGGSVIVRKDSVGRGFDNVACASLREASRSRQGFFRKRLWIADC